MNKELPYFKFYPNLWITGNITICSLEAQGLFINICTFYWSKQCSISLPFVKLKFSKDALLDELIELNIIQVDENDNLIIDFLDEQMNEFINVSEKRAIAGSKGGKAKAKQMLKFAKAKPSNIEKSIEEKKREEKKSAYEIVLDGYKTLCNKLPQVKILTQQRKKVIDTRVSDYNTEKIIDVFKIAGESNFLNGENDNNWTANFDWIMQPKNFVKILEGNYKNKTDSKKSNVTIN